MIEILGYLILIYLIAVLMYAVMDTYRKSPADKFGHQSYPRYFLISVASAILMSIALPLAVFIDWVNNDL